MAVLDWPVVLCPAKAAWGLQSNTETFTSPLNRSVQTLERPGARWKATLEFPPMLAEKRGVLEAFLASLNGMAGRFRLWPHARPGASTYTPQIYGAIADFKVLPAHGFPGLTLVLKAGDFLEAGGELKMVTADVVTDELGIAYIPVSPAFRAAPEPWTPITLDRPKAIMMLTADEFAVSVVPGMISESVVLTAVEAFI